MVYHYQSGKPLVRVVVAGASGTGTRAAGRQCRHGHTAVPGRAKTGPDRPCGRFPITAAKTERITPNSAQASASGLRCCARCAWRNPQAGLRRSIDFVPALGRVSERKFQRKEKLSENKNI